MIFKLSVDHENCDLLGYYATSSGNFLQTFWDNLSVPYLGVKIPSPPPKKKITTPCVVTQKSAFLIYFVAEA